MRLMDKARKGGKSPGDLPMPPRGNKVFYDDQLRGFGLRVTSAGARSFILNFLCEAVSAG